MYKFFIAFFFFFALPVFSSLGHIPKSGIAEIPSFNLNILVPREIYFWEYLQESFLHLPKDYKCQWWHFFCFMILVGSASILDFCLGPATLSSARSDLQEESGFLKWLWKQIDLAFLTQKHMVKFFEYNRVHIVSPDLPAWIIQRRPEGTSADNQRLSASDLSTCFRMQNYHSMVI